LRASAERTGIRHVIMMVAGTGKPTTRMMATMARLCADVLPRFSRLTTTGCGAPVSNPAAPASD
jgi:hypothetical protein